MNWFQVRRQVQLGADLSGREDRRYPRSADDEVCRFLH